MKFLSFVSYMKWANSMNRSYFINGDIGGLKELIFLRKGIVCLLVQSIFPFDSEPGFTCWTWACASYLLCWLFSCVSGDCRSSVALTKYCRLSDLKSRHLLLTVLEAGSPRSRRWQIHYQMTAFLLCLDMVLFLGGGLWSLVSLLFL